MSASYTRPYVRTIVKLCQTVTGKPRSWCPTQPLYEQAALQGADFRSVRAAVALPSTMRAIAARRQHGQYGSLDRRRRPDRPDAGAVAVAPGHIGADGRQGCGAG